MPNTLIGNRMGAFLIFRGIRDMQSPWRAGCIEKCKSGSEGGVAGSQKEPVFLPYAFCGEGKNSHKHTRFA